MVEVEVALGQALPFALAVCIQVIIDEDVN